MVRHFVALILMMVTIAGSVFDSGAAVDGIGNRASISSMNRAPITAPYGHTLFAGDEHPSEDGMVASDTATCHDCHIGHCCFVLPAVSLQGTFSPLKSLIYFRSNSLPDELISYIPRPPSSPALA